MNDKVTLDPELKEELENTGYEDNLLTEYGTPGGSNDKPQYEITEQWFPKQEEWQGKTIIHPRQAQALAAIRVLTDAFEEIEPLESVLIDMINNYEMYLTSIEGKSREQHTKVLQSMFAEPLDQESSNSFLRHFIAADENSDNE